MEAIWSVSEDVCFTEDFVKLQFHMEDKRYLDFHLNVMEL